MKVFQFPLAKITFFFIIGILLGYQISPNLSVIFTILCILLLLMCFCFWSKKNKLYGVSIFLFSLFLGLSTQSIHDVRNYSSHYISNVDLDSLPQIAKVCVSEKLKSNQFADRYFVTVHKIGNKSSRGKLLMNVYKDSSETKFNIGDNLLFASKLISHKPPNNPNQFDYGQYLRRKSVFAQVYVTVDQIQLSTEQTKSIWYYASFFREKIINNLRKYHFSEQELQVLNALILGQQQEIDRDVLLDYQFAGAVHVLSVSGLHVGYILLFLNFVLGFLPKNKFFAIIKLSVIILSLWSFAFIAGLSPSVVRSATMFTFLAVGQCLGRETNIFHTLIASLYFILLIEPSFVFDVGFQLSYVSLFFILWVQPMLRSLWIPKNIVLIYFWDIMTVSVAAQLGAFLLSVYYFHQFPGLFFITNLIILPTLGLIMAFGILVMIMAFFDYVPHIPAWILEKMIYCLNKAISAIAHFETFIIKDISLNQSMLICLYLLIFTMIFCWQKFSFSTLSGLFLVFFILQISIFFNKSNIDSTNSLLILNQSKKSILIKRHGRLATVYAADSILKKIQDNRIITSYLVANFLEIDQKKVLPNLLYFKSKKILIIDSTFVITKNIYPDIILLTQSPRLNFDRLLDIYKPKVIIADASNFKSYCHLWSATCKKRKIPFHATAEKGFYEID